MQSWTFIAGAEHDTDRLGRLLAEVLPDGTTIALRGTLGAGKTRLVRAIAVGCGIDAEEVVSPTFVLCQEYHGRRESFHLDAYRLRDAEEFEQLGPEEYFASSGLTFVEWADRVREAMPRAYLDIHIEVTGESARRFEFAAHGASLEPVIDRLAAACGEQ